MATRLPARRPSSVRRTVDLRIVPGAGWDGGLTVDGTGRDASVDGRGALSATATARTRVTLDQRSAVTGLSGGLPAAVGAALVGRPAVSGFRAQLRAVDASELHPESLEAALLDDLPTVRLISGYARMIEMDHRPGPPPAALLGVCRGWAPGDTAHRLAQAGEKLLERAPAAPPFDALLAAPDDFHPQTPSPPSSMRRRRILEVAYEGELLDIYEYFRDSHVDASGREGSLHEYEVRASVDPRSLVVTDIVVRPRALPFPECPLAAPNAGALRGTSLDDIEASVKNRLSGTRGCTHLNDVLRFLRFVRPLADRLPRGEN
ncbi:hypothetical protein HY68_33705 [Streptomyces sp. AcH 505]|uniref:DUF2889 domain-containing protein n=1 Tax=Streptomyces sp. AcH 505 TaxID=352211 RepID=UPI000591F180|nr:hypothetical protein HY68_33705 [Streptomyces sp. AcH 505]